MSLKVRIGISLFILFCQVSFAQVYKFKHLTIDNGLSQNTVNCIAQDKTGFIWIGTQSGLNRYDGYECKIYLNEKNNKNSISHNSIRCIYIDSDDICWIGTADGLNRFNPITSSFKRYYSDTLDATTISSSTINSIVEGNDGLLYISTFGGGVNVFNRKTEKFVHLLEPNSKQPLFDATIRKIVKDKSGNLWFSSFNKGVAQYNLKTKQLKQYTGDGTYGKNQLNYYTAKTLFVDKSGLVWVSCWSAGVNVINPTTGRVYSSADTSCFLRNLKVGLVWSFTEDKLGNIWLATAEEGVVIFDPKTGSVRKNKNDPDNQNTLSDNNAWSLFEDKSGVIWVGTWRGGVNIFDPKTLRFKHYKSDKNNPSGLNNNFTWYFHPSRSGKMYVGTSASVSIFDPNKQTFTSLPYDESIYDSPKHNSIISAICEDYDGTLWMGSNGAGVYHYNFTTGKYKRYPVGNDSTHISSETATSFLLDSKNNFWLGLFGGGLNKYNRSTDTFKWFINNPSDKKSISNNSILCMLERKDGKIWIGTSYGLNLFDPIKEHFICYNNDTANQYSISNDEVLGLVYDIYGKLWVGTGEGLNYFDETNQRFYSYGKKDGFPNDQINGLATDKNGNMWCSSDLGIFCFDPATKKVKSYDVTDGLQSNEFNALAYATALNGEIYFGGYNGFNCFLPETIKDNTEKPNVVFTGFTVLNKKYELTNEIAFTKVIDLTYKDYFFSFSFAGLEYSNSLKNMYKYKLENFNEDWIQIGNTHSLTFTNLDPGEYTLKIKAANNDGVWNETAAEIKINISPPFWRTKWFYALCILILISSIYLFIRYREKKLVQEKKLLEDKVEERTVELRDEKLKVEMAHKDIKDSINYAKRIQEAILPHSEEIVRSLPTSFILFQPKDVVSGDFYWFATAGNKVLIAAADCTGHGVPGALMSMVGNTLLNEIVKQKGITEPAEILNNLHIGVRQALRQDKHYAETRDGMDIALCCITDGKTVEYAGANRSFLYIDKEGVKEIKANKFPIGGLQQDEERKFTNHSMALEKGDMFYLFSDGYADQFGGDKGKKFMVKNFHKLLLSVSIKNMEEQKIILGEAINNWKEGYEQIDDILVIGVKM